jgi:D-alanyl-D-alanine carboxypeptidase/D-alanyl-D-alanine-endopeptidase (penicillin-binding protein 4)
VTARTAAVLAAALAAWGCASDASAAPRRYAQMTEAQVTALLARAQRTADLGARAQAVSEPFLGTPYVLGNLGEGPGGDGRDTDPRFNLQSVDCTTFVEHVLAFTHASSVEQARARLDAIRYTRGQVGYGTRRHWPDAQWIPGLVGEGFLVDVTAQVGGPVEEASVTLGPDLFQASAHAATMSLHPDEVPVGTFKVPYVPLERVVAAAPRLEPGTVVNVVKAQKPGLLVRVSHQGLVVVRGPGNVAIRHASSVEKKVVDEPLAAFVKRNSSAKGWPTVGLNFLRLAPWPPAIPAVGTP